ncbi:hypothetical protein MHBO_002390 [Bonamia ostreae]|uniref:Uncharacterized protein n=1 Tax=Bonamia ostreae TaxID=126728 RepID=A0ABV2AM64_9EUKA
MVGDKCPFVCEEDYETSGGAQNGVAVCKETLNGLFEFEGDIGCYLKEKKSNTLVIVLSIFGSVLGISLLAVLFLHCRKRICKKSDSTLPTVLPVKTADLKIQENMNDIEEDNEEIVEDVFSIN